ncbi:response regulator [Kovacikia minuta CCNUW1]|uniref:hybrid sensor histidine kinase/response regulator n=1 Tax=Kovacikia minuta TaxID=2931930 RepID=UPI001CCDCDA6|nr:ATP-binding protein [Kovacikia minuta]UBF24481.1 response regulator [Kovacikia minuta CCNUW1]
MPPIKLLVVEDEQLVADDLRETLELLGYDVSALVASGEDAIRQVELLQPDLVLMDIRLSGVIDGIEAARQIQARFQVPVIYLTANADRITLERVKATHPFGYILKPFNETILSTTIEIAWTRHQAEIQVQNALRIAENSRKVAESQVQRRSEYFSMASHELRNPLTAIQFATDFLHRYGDQLPDAKKQKYLERIKTATNSLNYLLENVLTLARVDAGKLQFDPQLIDVTQFCQEQVEAFQLSCGEHYTLTFSAPQTPCNAYLDEKLLWHLLNNLLSNSIKYSPPGSTVSLTLTCTGETIRLEVKDQGVGIPPDALLRLFEPFHRAANVNHIPGTGLGLAIAKQCVDLHHGQIHVESTLNQGTNFTVTLPRRGS